MKKIKKVMEKYPFYQWKYKDLGNNINYQLLPIIEKEDLIKYEIETGKKFYECNSSDCKENLKFFCTTGTLGKLMKFPYIPNHENFCKCLKNIIQDLQNHGIIMKNFAYQKIGPEDMQYLLKSSTRYYDKTFVIEKNDLDDFSKYLSENKIDTICDFTLDLIKIIIKKNISSEISGLKNIIIMSMDEYNFNIIRRLGYNIISYFGCMEFGVLGFSINSLKNIYKYMGIAYFDRELIKDKGSLVLSGMVGEFPLIKYSTNDIIEIVDENISEIYFKYKGRKTTYAIPNAFEGNFNYGCAIKCIEKKYVCFSDFLFIGYQIKEKGVIQNILALFIVSDKKIENKILQKDIMIAGFGGYFEEYINYFPIYYVSQGMINKSGRNKHFINLRSSLHLRYNDYAQLNTLIEKDYKIVSDNYDNECL